MHKLIKEQRARAAAAETEVIARRPSRFFWEPSFDEQQLGQQGMKARSSMGFRSTDGATWTSVAWLKQQWQGAAGAAGAESARAGAAGTGAADPEAA